MPAAKATSPASSHSIRHTWTACQSSTVLAVYIRPVATAAIVQIMPTTNATRDPTDSPNASLIMWKSRNWATFRPKLMRDVGFAASRPAPHTWQKRDPSTYSVLQRWQTSTCDLTAGLTSPAAPTCPAGRQYSWSKLCVAPILDPTPFGLYFARLLPNVETVGSLRATK